MIVKGQKINDRYEVRKLIGEGGMANVYLGYDTILERDVAIKVLRGDLADDEKFVRRFRREAQSASLLNHPNIVQIYDVGEDDGNFYIVMEYIKGQTLKQLIKKRGKLSVPETVDIMSQLTDGLAHAHDSYIIHRDIKPQNIMILDDGMVKITDFGIAMAINASDLTQTNSVMGSVHYLPPEQASGKGSTIKSDIYSLGIMMYEMLAGVMPYRGETAVEIAMKHLKNPMPSVIKANETVPQSVENIILKATAKNPKNRYNNVRELYDDLKTCQDKSKMDEERIVFKYPENEYDNEDTKVVKSIKDDIKETPKQKKKSEPEVKELDVEDYKEKRLSKFTKILIALVGVMVSALFAVFIIIPSISTTPEVKVPNVSGLAVADAKKKLEDVGLEINTEIKEDYTESVEKGLISKSEPKAGEKVKKHSTVTLYKSMGSKNVTIEDYTGKDSDEIRKTLEKRNINVSIEKKDVENKKDYEGKEKIIVDQSPKEGTLTEGDTIILYVPNLSKGYPDFVGEKWTVQEVETFCQENSINLSVEYESTNDYAEGTIISQSRAADSKIVTNANLTIKVAKKKTEDEHLVPIEDANGTNNNNNSNSNTNNSNNTSGE
ncbi:MAG: Stk1 family PASTA domain-containing Ser/Thr kinase [Bacilli bacterium]|nr:Stk1 family PASTA domain-containing Ser/Thr kinase [Bacilli bacterium]